MTHDDEIKILKQRFPEMFEVRKFMVLKPKLSPEAMDKLAGVISRIAQKEIFEIKNS